MAGQAQAIGVPNVWVRDIVFTAAVALTVSFLGPYGSYGQPLLDRVVTSFAFGAAAGVWIWPVMRWLMRRAAQAQVPELFTVVAGLAVLTGPVAAISRLVDGVLHPGHADPPALELYFAVLAMVLPVGAAYLLVERWMARVQAGPPGAPEPAPPRLLERLPARLGRELLALQAEDHYVRVHTAAGSDLLLMRFADAIAEADGVAGLRVHRSWWVARGAVTSGRAEGRRAVLTLSTGVEVPVTREAVPEVRKLGWL